MQPKICLRAVLQAWVTEQRASGYSKLPMSSSTPASYWSMRRSTSTGWNRRWGAIVVATALLGCLRDGALGHKKRQPGRALLLP
jgi:hypothetical protein